MPGLRSLIQAERNEKAFKIIQKKMMRARSTGCGRKKWTPKFFRRFLSNHLGF